MREAAWSRKPDPEWGEKVHAFVVAAARRTRLTQPELIAFCREGSPASSARDVVEFIGELPRNALGKFLKSELRARVLRQAAADGQANQVKKHA